MTAYPKHQKSLGRTLAVNHKLEGGLQWRSVFVIVCGLSLLIGSSRAFGAANVVGGKLVSVTQSGPHSFDYAFALVVKNGAPALNSATITASTQSREIQIIQGEVSLGPVAANSKFVTDGTIVVRVHERDDDYFEELSFLLVPGPGPVAQAQINGATGGTIAVTDPGDPLFGTQITFPPGALSDNETITVGYSDSLPGAFPVEAIAAGEVQVTSVVTLSRSGTARFLQPVTVTIPYQLGALEPGDFPAMVYWDPSIGIYQPVQVVSVDQTKGFLIFVTSHFSGFVGTGIPGLTNMLLERVPSSASSITAICPGCPANLSFSPANDGFEIANFTASVSFPKRARWDGQCAGMAAYAAWYYMHQPAGGVHLFQKYGAYPGLSLHSPEEDAEAREIAAAAQENMTAASFRVLQPDPTLKTLTPQQDQDLETASAFINGLYDTKSPQQVDLCDSEECQAAGDIRHEVLIYGWDAATQTFDVYDSNYPYPATTPPIEWETGKWVLAPYEGHNFIYADARGTSTDDSLFQQYYSNVENGLPPQGNWLFDTLQITSPLGNTSEVYPGGPNGPFVTVDPLNGTNLSFSWICLQCAAATYALQVYQNGNRLPGVPIESGVPVTIQSAKFTGTSTELFAFVSDPESDLQGDISHDYGGYQGVTLIPVLPTTITLTSNPSSLPSTGGTVTLTATVSSPTAPTGVPALTGTVTFLDQFGGLLCLATVSSGAAQCNATIASAPDTVTANYLPSSNSAYGASTASFVVSAGGTTFTYTFTACMDGRDLLMIQGSTLQWQHLDYQAVGLANDCPPGASDAVGIDTTNNGTAGLSTSWLPTWALNPPPSGTLSSTFTGLSPALPSGPMTVSLNVIAARTSLTIYQQPSAANNWTLILDFNDDPLPGATVYTGEVTVTVP